MLYYCSAQYSRDIFFLRERELVFFILRRQHRFHNDICSVLSLHFYWTCGYVLGKRFEVFFFSFLARFLPFCLKIIVFFCVANRKLNFNIFSMFTFTKGSSSRYSYAHCVYMYLKCAAILCAYSHFSSFFCDPMYQHEKKSCEVSSVGSSEVNPKEKEKNKRFSKGKLLDCLI